MVQLKENSHLWETFLSYAQNCISTNPVLVIGSGASMAYGIPGMKQLCEHLVETVKVNENFKPTWQKFIELSKEQGLEPALSQFYFELPPEIVQQIQHSTWKLINDADCTVFSKLLEKKLYLSLSKIIEHIFRSTHTYVNVVTTNYDRLVEYAANLAENCYFDGFQQGYFQTWKPQLRELQYRNLRNSAWIAARTVRVWKVHGSLDWFTNTRPIALPNTFAIPAGFYPLIITPGLQKYELTHEEPFRTILSCADNALQAANSFLCIGYGFNDKHIQPKLIENCHKKSTKIVVIARELTKSAKDFLFSENCKSFLAFEKSDNGTMVFSKECLTGTKLVDLNLWDLHHFIDKVLQE